MPLELTIHFYSIDHQTEEKSFFSTAHAHQHYEVFFFTKGQATHFIDFEAYAITDNACFLVAYNQMHYIEAPPFSHNVGFVVSFNIAYGDLLDHDFQYLVSAFGQNPAYYLPEETQALITALFQQIRAEISWSLPKSQSLVLQYLRIILIHIHRLKQEKTINTSDHVNRVLFDFSNALEKHFKEEKTVQAYADELNITARKLNRFCQTAYQKTALQVIHHRLNLEAKRLLFYSKIPIKEIGYQLGFEDPAHFSNFFKKLNQESPDGFRQRMTQIFK